MLLMKKSKVNKLNKSKENSNPPPISHGEEPKELMPLKTKDNVDHVGLSQLLKLWKVLLLTESN